MIEKNITMTTTCFTEQEANIIAEENLGLIHHIIKTLNIKDFDYADLYDAGLFGYTKAIKSFDKNRNTQFSTYACNCIRNEILAQMKKEMKHISNDISLNKQIATNGNNKDLLVRDIIEDDSLKLNHIEDIMIEDDTQKKIMRALAKLDESEQFVIKHRYGIIGCKEMLQTEIAQTLNMSQANVSKLEKSGLKKLKLFISLYK